MRHISLLLLLALAACPFEPDDPGDAGAGGDAGPPPVELAPGETAELQTEADAVSIRLASAGTYLVVLMSQNERQGTTLGYSTEAQKAMRSQPSDKPPAQRPAAPPRPKTEVGDTRTFSVYNGSSTITITAEATRVTARFVVWEDKTTANPFGSIDMAKVDSVIQKLEAVVVPREEQIFGAISDVDSDGKLALLLSYTVNQYGARAYVSPCDIGALQGCGGGGNGGEIIYFNIPDPTDMASSANGLTETVAHELSHLIYSYHKLILNGVSADGENIYLTEGLAALAQDLTGYNNGNQFVWAAAIDMADYYGGDDNYSAQALSINDMFRGSTYYNADRDGALRGGSYLFLRFVFEQMGGMQVDSSGTLTDGGGIAWIQDLYDAPEQGVEALEQTTGRALWDLALDWYTAIAATGRGVSVDPSMVYAERFVDPITTYSYGVDPFAALPHGVYTLHGPPVQAWDEPDGEIRAGGVEYLRIEAKPGELRLPVGGEALARARILRLE
ncbi:MAG: hypothetical protein ABIJ09_01810 [Pseudomonadota bacterium]